ncbi:MAG: beta-ketoacyl synthase N-terminal-like domain-containing protein, partial [Acidobacteriota bacterium]
GLARGYLNQPELTIKNFIDNPFHSGTKLYKTGDLARWLPDGKIEYLGRIDDQVKIRGFRIELGEIENQLNKHPQIQNSVVLAKEQEGTKQIIAYYVPKKQPLDASVLRGYLQSKLPEYMVPAFFISLDKIPLTTNGKTDRKELISRQVLVNRTENISIPQTEIEGKILDIWRSVLKIENISTTDGFFEAGGDSILALILSEKISKAFDFNFTVTSLFKYSTVQAVSQYISSMNGNHTASQSKKEKNLSLNPLKKDKKPYRDYYQNSLAIIGISCHFPMAKDYHEFWHNLREGKESSRFLSQEELRKANVSEELIRNPAYVPVQVTIDGKELFDPGFFNISYRNAEFMDPQFRLLLMHSWKAIEDAGYIPKDIPETSVFMSASNSFYQNFLHNTNRIQPSDEYLAFVLAQGGTIPTMISYQLGLKGPSLFVHTNCSSSLAGLYLAYQSLQSNEAKYALIGGSTIFPTSNIGYVYQEGMNFSSDGHCRTFDACANGMIAGEGVAVILVKKALNAIEDGDHIYALLRGISVNNDGSNKAGFYAPSVNGQAEVIQKVLDTTKINPESISYVEAHGTATKLGDPIEVMALSEVYQRYTRRKQFCGIGSVKSNIGHLDTTAGLAGCIKVALSLYKGEIPPSINYKKPNPAIDFNTSPFYVVDKLKEWKTDLTPRRAALSSFGIGGTNAHAILEEYLEETEVRNEKSEIEGPYLIVFSAKNEDRLKEVVKNIYQFLTNHLSSLILADIAYTLQVGREAMQNRLLFIVNNIEELMERLEEYIEGKENIKDCFKNVVQPGNNTVQLLENDEDSKELIIQWITKRRFKKIAELWVKGYYLDWKLFYSHGNPRRISLPTYPFAKEPYCLPVIKNSITANTDNWSDKESEVGLKMLTPVWNSISLTEQRSLFPNRTDKVVIVGGTHEQRNAIKTVYP